MKFLLTRPMRGATNLLEVNTCVCRISTHTPHAGRDASHLGANRPEIKFLLTRPMRGATREQFISPPLRQFLLTRPMRGATERIHHVGREVKFLLTRPMRGAT